MTHWRRLGRSERHGEGSTGSESASEVGRRPRGAGSAAWRGQRVGRVSGLSGPEAESEAGVGAPHHFVTEGGEEVAAGRTHDVEPEWGFFYFQVYALRAAEAAAVN